MAKSQKNQTFVLKINTGYLSKHNWDLHLELDKALNITVIQVYSPTSNAEEAAIEQFYEDLQDLPELTPPKSSPFHHRRLECKSRNQEIPRVTGKHSLGVQNEAGQS